MIEFQALRQRILKSVGGDAEIVFQPALSLLFLLGKVEYHTKNDSFEYREG
ncbi:ABC-three component system middle component 8 [Streptomyces sp. NPDC017988]|uniref:ABC-three component system middle component 8 n=1 Tax=Streptomyces sp. NPDC017988 TaxID=3365025 RepID=UPI0037B27C27